MEYKPTTDPIEAGLILQQNVLRTRKLLSTLDKLLKKYDGTITHYVHHHEWYVPSVTIHLAKPSDSRQVVVILEGIGFSIVSKTPTASEYLSINMKREIEPESDSDVSLPNQSEIITITNASLSNCRIIKVTREVPAHNKEFFEIECDEQAEL